MSSIQKAHEKLPGSLILLLAASAGFGVAALYYSQPMLGVLGPDIGASARSVGFVPTLTQLGYALGILLLAPLGEFGIDKRRRAVHADLLVSNATPIASAGRLYQSERSETAVELRWKVGDTAVVTVRRRICIFQIAPALMRPPRRRCNCHELRRADDIDPSILTVIEAKDL